MLSNACRSNHGYLSGWCACSRVHNLRMQLYATLVAERSGISRSTLWRVENGNPSVAVGIYAAVLHALNNMDKDLLKIAGDDELGRKPQDIELLRRGKRQ